MDGPHPSPKRVSAAIRELPVRDGDRWCVMSYILNHDVANGGQLDNLFGIAFLLGGFSSKKKADKYAATVIEKAGVNSVIVAEFGRPVPLHLNPTGGEKIVFLDEEGHRIEDKQTQLHEEKYKEDMKRREEIEEEILKEGDPNDIEHLKRACYIACKNYALYMHMTEKAKEAKDSVDRRVQEAKEHISKHPDHTNTWLPMFKEKLSKRGEMDLYYAIEKTYNTVIKSMVEG